MGDSGNIYEDIQINIQAHNKCFIYKHIIQTHTQIHTLISGHSYYSHIGSPNTQTQLTHTLKDTQDWPLYPGDER